jgi:hypothetical protein
MTKTVLRMGVAAAAVALLAGCGVRGVVPSLVLLDGHRRAADPCRNVAVTAYTRQWLTQGGTLVACPEDLPRLERFAAQTDALAVARVQGYVLYRVGGPPLAAP